MSSSRPSNTLLALATVTSAVATTGLVWLVANSKSEDANKMTLCLTVNDEAEASTMTKVTIHSVARSPNIYYIVAGGGNVGGNHSLTNKKFEDLSNTLMNEMERIKRAAAYLMRGEQGAEPCPRLVWIVPKKASGDGKSWFKEPWFSFSKTTIKKPIKLYFICDHSLEVVEPPLEFEVTREWIAKVAPALKMCALLLKAALGAAALSHGVVLPFPVEGVSDNGKIKAFDDFVNEFVSEEVKFVRDVSNVLSELNDDDRFGDENQPSKTKEVVRVTGIAYNTLAQKANEKGNEGWKYKMTPALKANGQGIVYVKNKYFEDYKSKHKNDKGDEHSAGELSVAQVQLPVDGATHTYGSLKTKFDEKFNSLWKQVQRVLEDGDIKSYRKECSVGSVVQRCLTTLQQAQIVAGGQADMEGYGREGWAKKWAKALRENEQWAWDLNLCRKVCLEFYYSIYNNYYDSTATTRRQRRLNMKMIENGLKQFGVDHITAIVMPCLVMDRANALYNMNNRVTQEVGRDWYAEMDEPEMRKMYNGDEPPTTPMLNRRLRNLLEFEGLPFRNNAVMRRWMEPVRVHELREKEKKENSEADEEGTA